VTRTSGTRIGLAVGKFKPGRLNMAPERIECRPFRHSVGTAYSRSNLKYYCSKPLTALIQVVHNQ
jgi:hypothetical protein